MLRLSHFLKTLIYISMHFRNLAYLASTISYKFYEDIKILKTERN